MDKDLKMYIADEFMKLNTEGEQREFIENLEEAVEEAKRNREWGHEYMTLLMRDQGNREQEGWKKFAGMDTVIKDKNSALPVE